MGLGLGKTASTLTAIQEMYDNFDPIGERVLIIAPLRVANTVWHTEAANWEHTRHMQFAIATGAVKNRVEALKRNAQITVINRENIPWLVDHYKNKWPFKLVVIDESSSFKNPTAKRFRALRKVRKHIDKMTLLTATPAANGYLDLWSQIFLLDGGHSLGYTFTAFKNSYFDSDFMGYTYTLKDGAMHAIQDKINPLVLSMSTKDYSEVPEYVPSVMSNPLTGKLLKQYLTFEKDALLNIDDETELNAVSAAVLTNKLLQFCSGAVYYDEPDDEGNLVRHTEHFHDLKLDSLDEILEFNPGENIMVVYNYKHELERLLKKYPQAVVMDKKGEAVAKWNNGEIPMLLVHPKSAGHGLNLQHGGSIMVFFGFTWSLEEYEQVIGRLCRQGQTKIVKVIHIAVGEAEDKLMRTLARKGITQAELLESLK